MELKISGKSTGVGAYDDGLVIGRNPDRTETSRTGNHWEYEYKNIPNDAIIIYFGNNRNGTPYRKCILANGQPVPPERMHEVEKISEWKERG